MKTMAVWGLLFVGVLIGIGLLGVATQSPPVSIGVLWSAMPLVFGMAQAQGSNARLILASEATFKTSPTLLIEDCEDAWTQGDADFTMATATGKVGTNCVKMSAAAGASAGDLAMYENFTAVDLSGKTIIGFWCKSSIALATGDLQLLLDDTDGCVSPIETIDIPAIVTADIDTWVYRKCTIATPASCTAIQSIGIKYTVDKGAMDFYIDDVRALKASAQVFPFKSGGLSLKRGTVESEVLRGNRNPQKPSTGDISLDGSIPTELNAYMGILLKHLMGNVATTALGGGAYQHVFTIGDLPAGLTAEMQNTDVNIYRLFNGVKVNSMKLGVSPTGKVSFDFGLIGSKQVAATAVTTLDGDPTDYGHNPFDAIEATLEKDGVALANATEISIDMANNISGEPVIGSAGEFASLPEGKVKVSGSITVLFEDFTLYNIALANTEFRLVLKFTKGAGDGTSGDEYIEFALNELTAEVPPADISSPGGLKLTFPVNAYYDDHADASAMTITLKNTQASIV